MNFRHSSTGLFKTCYIREAVLIFLQSLTGVMFHCDKLDSRIESNGAKFHSASASKPYINESFHSPLQWFV